LLALSYSGAAISARLGHIALARPACNGATVKSAAYPRAESAALRMADKQGEEAERPRTSVYQMLDDEQIANIHNVADALFNVLDRNGDGVISQEELACHLLLARYDEEAVLKIFGLVDVNSDGQLSRVELREAFIRYPSLLDAPGMGSQANFGPNEVHMEADEVFAKVDTNGDGLLSLEELSAYLAGVEGPSYSPESVARVYDTLDANGDGQVTQSVFRGGFVRYKAIRLGLGLRQPKLGWLQSPG